MLTGRYFSRIRPDTRQHPPVDCQHHRPNSLQARLFPRGFLKPLRCCGRLLFAPDLSALRASCGPLAQGVARSDVNHLPPLYIVVILRHDSLRLRRCFSTARDPVPASSPTTRIGPLLRLPCHTRFPCGSCRWQRCPSRRGRRPAPLVGSAQSQARGSAEAAITKRGCCCSSQGRRVAAE